MNPAVIFLIIFSTSILFSHLFSRLAYKKEIKDEGASKAYSCGEEMPDHMIQPDYSQFFHFAFYFTILHVVALIIATVPLETPATLVMALLYVTGVLAGLLILLEQ